MEFLVCGKDLSFRNVYTYLLLYVGYQTIQFLSKTRSRPVWDNATLFRGRAEMTYSFLSM